MDERQERREAKRINENQAFSPVRKWAGATKSLEFFSVNFFHPIKKGGAQLFVFNFFFFLKKCLNFFVRHPSHIL
jgi:hypothetical protein